MIVYCVMEDWYNKQPMSKDYDSYQDKLIAIFNSQHDALNNILINVDRDIWKNVRYAFPVSVLLDNRGKLFDPEYDVEETLHRYIKPVEIGKLVY